jgi:hypothetical protein
MKSRFTTHFHLSPVHSEFLHKMYYFTQICPKNGDKTQIYKNQNNLRPNLQ